MLSYKILQGVCEPLGVASVVAGGSGRCGEPVRSSCETENGIDGE